jgi:1,4-alpha-glucan branching enzyme
LAIRLRTATETEANMQNMTNIRTTETKPQSFSCVNPDARSVQLVGDFTNWQEHPIPLHREATGEWHTAIRLAPGTHYYRFLVDGQWRDDPACPMKVPNPFGSQNAVRQVN